MLEPPPDVTCGQVLAVVRASWDAEVDRVEHLPVGFGAHHWRADVEGRPRWFVTLDELGSRHTSGSLEAAYAGAAALAEAGLAFVHASAPATSGRHTVPMAAGAVSVTPWLDGERVGSGPPRDARSAADTARMLRRLHTSPAPARIRRWAPFIDPGLAEDLTVRTSVPWTAGPLGEQARSALRRRLTEIAGWTDTYHRRAREALDRDWVTTHGEPHTRNQVRTPEGTVLVDWESLKLAPAERDLRTLVDAGRGDLVDAEPAMLELFDLEWRLNEMSQYSDRFEAPHEAGPDSRTALAGLLAELERD